jgi:hypothetical protein
MGRLNDHPPHDRANRRANRCRLHRSRCPPGWQMILYLTMAQLREQLRLSLDVTVLEVDAIVIADTDNVSTYELVEDLIR